jgi:hypothetical protein
MEDYDLTGNLEGFTYQQLLNWALEECESFSLVTRKGTESNKEKEINKRLKPFLLEEIQTNEWPGTKVIGPPEHNLRFYKLDRNSVKILSEANSVYSWLAPDRPEDLAFYKENKCLWFGSVAHENMAFFNKPSFNKGEVQKRLIETAVLN